MITKPLTMADVRSPSADKANPNESALWKKLTSLARPISAPHTLKARGVEVGTLVFRILSATELGSVYADAHRATKDDLAGDEAKGFVAYEEIYLEQKALHLVALACRQPDDPQFPTFFNAKGVRDHLTDDEIGVVLAAYNIFRRESGPICSVVEDAECEAVYGILSKGSDKRLMLSRYSSEGLIDLVLYAAPKFKIPDVVTEPSDAEPRPDGAVAPDVAASPAE